MCVADQNAGSSDHQILTGSLQPPLSHSFLMSAPMTMTRVSLISSLATSPLNFSCHAKAKLFSVSVWISWATLCSGFNRLPHFTWTLLQCKGSDYHNGLGSGYAQHSSIITYKFHIITDCHFHLELHSVSSRFIWEKKKKKRIYSPGYRTFIRQQSNNPQIIFLTFNIMFLFQVVDFHNILQSK